MTEKKLKEIIEVVMDHLDVDYDEIKMMSMAEILDIYEKIKGGSANAPKDL